MFRQLARLMVPPNPPAPPIGPGLPAAEAVFTIHPIQLSRFLEEVWSARNPNLQVFTPTDLEIPTAFPEVVLESSSGLQNHPEIVNAGNRGFYPPRVWDQLIYAYMIENTRAYEIFRRVLEEYAYGERLSVPRNESQRWLRTTEQLFYRDNPPFQIYSIASWIRPDMRAVRRNAYHRMFGLDLNHGTDDNRPYPYPRAAAANTDFVPTFEELLRESWRAIENIRNQVGPNQTDISTLGTLATTLFNMLRVRRQDNNAGNLGRDELLHVSVMSWFHLTLTYDTPIVVDLKAQAPSPAERLQKIGERVGLPAHSRSDSYFHLAESMSLLLRELEMGTFNAAPGVNALFQPGRFQEAVQETITHWTVATGRDIKARPTAIAAPQPVPIRPTPSPIVGVTPAGNGRAAVGREVIPT
jgi:hypothetical protein